MTDRPTPETDAFSVKFKSICGSKAWVPTDICRRLERERDELMAYLDAAHYATCNAELRKERDEAMAKYAAEATDHMLAVNKLCNERDEARKETEYYKERYEQLKDVRDEAREKIERQAERIRYLEGATNHACGTPLTIALRERDEAREDAAHWKTEYEIVVARLCGKKHPRDNGIISEHEIIPKLTQERDEAREKYDTLATEYMLEVNKLCNERDEAREQAQQMSESNQVLMADVRFYRDAWEQLKDQYGR